MDLKDFYYNLPEKLIAQEPIEDRSKSNLLVLHKENGFIEHKTFEDVIDYLIPGDCIVFERYKSNSCTINWVSKRYRR